jgi:hypothetical protein
MEAPINSALLKNELVHALTKVSSNQQATYDFYAMAVSLIENMAFDTTSSITLTAVYNKKTDTLTVVVGVRQDGVSAQYDLEFTRHRKALAQKADYGEVMRKSPIYEITLVAKKNRVAYMEHSTGLKTLEFAVRDMGAKLGIM